ncbi:MAG TPA: hypothetical protein V6C72_16755, partial [Chroococcales cyanobacterium]
TDILLEAAHNGGEALVQSTAVAARILKQDYNPAYAGVVQHMAAGGYGLQQIDRSSIQIAANILQQNPQAQVGPQEISLYSSGVPVEIISSIRNAGISPAQMNNQIVVARVVEAAQASSNPVVIQGAAMAASMLGENYSAFGQEVAQILIEDGFPPVGINHELYNMAYEMHANDKHAGDPQQRVVLNPTNVVNALAARMQRQQSQPIAPVVPATPRTRNAGQPAIANPLPAAPRRLIVRNGQITGGFRYW